MGWFDKFLTRNSEGVAVPQYYNEINDNYEVVKGSNGAFNVQQAGSNVEEQHTQADAVSGTVTFSNPIQHLEIYNTDATNQGVFNVNGINITVPAGESFKASYGGTPSANVSVTGATSYILTRYE